MSPPLPASDAHFRPEPQPAPHRAAHCLPPSISTQKLLSHWLLSVHAQPAAVHPASAAVPSAMAVSPVPTSTSGPTAASNAASSLGASLLRRSAARFVSVPDASVKKFGISLPSLTASPATPWPLAALLQAPRPNRARSKDSASQGGEKTIVRSRR